MVWLKYRDALLIQRELVLLYIYYYMVTIMVELLYLATHMDIVHQVTRVLGL